MNDCIVLGFRKCEFNAAFLTANAVGPLDQPHQPVDQRSDGFDFTRHPGLDLEERTRMSPGKLRSQIRWSFGGLYSSHGKRLMLMENALRVPKPEAFLKQPNLLICCEMRAEIRGAQSNCQSGAARGMVPGAIFLAHGLH